MPHQDCEDALRALHELAGRHVLVLFRTGDEPFASVNGTLEPGVIQDRGELVERGWVRPEPESGPVVAFGVGDGGVFILSEDRLVEATFDGNHVRLEYVDGLWITVRDVASLNDAGTRLARSRPSPLQ